MPSHTPASPDRAPLDRGHLLTEQRNPRTRHLDTLSVRACVALLNEEDATVPAAVMRAGDAITGFIEATEARMRAGGRLIYIGAGTSGRLGVLDAAECPPTFRTPPGLVVGIIAGGDLSLRRSSESKEDDPHGAHEALKKLELTQHDTLLGIAAGGTTPYVLGAIDLAHSCGALTGLLCCAHVEARASEDHLIVIETGPEAITGSTRMKAGAATKFVLNTISTTLMVRMGKVYENLMVDLSATNEKLRDRAARIAMEVTGVSREGALALLERAGGDLKTAIVMHNRSVDLDTARVFLDQAQGRLREALEGHA